jgi:hypothetical protein
MSNNFFIVDSIPAIAGLQAGRSPSPATSIGLLHNPDVGDSPAEPEASASIHSDYEGIRWASLPKYQLPANPRKNRAWIWGEGYCIEETKTGDLFWLCKICHTARRYKSHIWKASGGTSLPLKHMKDVHKLTERGPVPDSKKRSFFDAFKQSDGSINARDRDIVHGIITSFRPDRFKTRIIRWIVHENIAFNQIESPFFRDIFSDIGNSMGRKLDDHLPTHKTVRDWILKDFNKFKDTIKKHLHGTLGKVHVSFDLWTSRSLLSLCGIVVHFVDSHGKLCTYLLSLPEVLGNHTGVNISDTVATILRDYGIADRIGYFVLDNADNNDTAIEALGEIFDFDPNERYEVHPYVKAFAYANFSHQIDDFAALVMS